MKERYFYVKPDESMPLELQGDIVYKINVHDINALALFATTLIPEPETTEALGYSAALYTYYSQNNNELRESYLKLVSNGSGKDFLCTSIRLSLWEKMLRENDISEEMISGYISDIEKYKKLLGSNSQRYGEESLGMNL